MDIINPATEKVLQQLDEDSKESLAKKFTMLSSQQPVWKSVTLEDRVLVCKGFGVLLNQNIEELATILTSEVGKPLQQSRNEINGAIKRIEWLTDNATTYLANEIVTKQTGLQERISYEPLGVVCNISAWNYPYLVGVNVFIPALLAGNAVMYKPSEHASLTGLQIEKYLIQAGVPVKVFAVAIGGAKTGEQLLKLPFNGYFFTGSYHTGKYIYEKVAAKMVPCQCELGGKDALYVTDEIDDLKAVAEATADGAFYNNGQSCCAVERIYVHEKVYDQYIEAFTSQVKSWRVGNPEEADIYFGPLTRKEQIPVLEKQIVDAVRKGATILTGGRRLRTKGFYFEPTVLINVTHKMKVMRDETFGPLIGICKVATDDEAIALMNDSEYGLTASVYSNNQQRAEAILQKADTGTAYWNCCDRVSAALPWSGRRHSGIGSTLGHIGLRAFTHPRAWHLKKNG